MIKTGRRLFVSPYSLQPGDLIEFGYNNKVRLCVVISPDWKDRADCYQFDRIEDAEEILEWILEGAEFLSGDLYVDFGNSFDFKSFKHENMRSIQRIEYNLEEQEQEQTEKQEEKIEEVKEVIPPTIYNSNQTLYGE